MATDDDNDGRGWRSRLPRLLAAVPNMSEFSRRSGVNRRMLDRYRDGMEPSLDAAVRIMNALDLPLDTLVNDIDVQDRPVASSDADTTYVPLMSVVGAAGNGIENHEVEVIDRLPFSRKLLQKLGVRREFAQFIRHQGDSMLPTLSDGGVCLIDTSRARPRDGGIYAVMVGDDVLIKRLQMGARGLTLISDNAEKYPPETLEGDEIGRVKVIGKVFWAGGRM